jgi:hypothetical protein
MGTFKTLTAFLRRADEGALSRLLVETSILLAASRGNATNIPQGCRRCVQGGHRSHRPKGQAGVRGQGEGQEDGTTRRQDRKESRLVSSNEGRQTCRP